MRQSKVCLPPRVAEEKCCAESMRSTPYLFFRTTLEMLGSSFRQVTDPEDDTGLPRYPLSLTRAQMAPRMRFKPAGDDDAISRLKRHKT